MATTPKAVEFSDDARRAYVPAPHHDSGPDAPIQGVPDDSFVAATDDTLTPAADGTPAKDGTTDEEDAEDDDEDDEDEDDEDDEDDEEEDDDEEDDDEVTDAE